MRYLQSFMISKVQPKHSRKYLTHFWLKPLARRLLTSRDSFVNKSLVRSKAGKQTYFCLFLKEKYS